MNMTDFYAQMAHGLARDGYAFLYDAAADACRTSAAREGVAVPALAPRPETYSERVAREKVWPS